MYSHIIKSWTFMRLCTLIFTMANLISMCFLEIDWDKLGLTFSVLFIQRGWQIKVHIINFKVFIVDRYITSTLDVVMILISKTLIL